MGLSLQCAAKSSTCAGNHRCELYPASDAVDGRFMSQPCFCLLSKQHGTH